MIFILSFTFLYIGGLSKLLTDQSLQLGLATSSSQMSEIARQYRGSAVQWTFEIFALYGVVAVLMFLWPMKRPVGGPLLTMADDG